MPRKARIDAPGALHHVIIRGIERRSEEWGRLCFYALLLEMDIIEDTAEVNYVTKSENRCARRAAPCDH